jgi:hypothetical protein
VIFTWISECVGLAFDDLIMVHIRFSFVQGATVYRLEIFGNNYTKAIPDERFNDVSAARQAAETWAKGIIERAGNNGN